MHAQSLQLFPTLCDAMDCRPAGSSLHRISQARILECVAISFSKGIFLIKKLNPGVLHWRRILYHLSHQKKIPKTLIYMSIYIHIQVHVLEITSLCPISSTLIYFNSFFLPSSFLYFCLSFHVKISTPSICQML